MMLIIKTIIAQDSLDYKKINDLYYHMNDYKFNGYTANVEVDMLEQLKKSITDEKALNELNNIVLKVEFLGKDSINFLSNYIEDSDGNQSNKGVSQMIKGLGETVKGSLITWAAFTHAPVFKIDKYVYKAEVQGSKTIIRYQEHGMDCIEYLTNSVTVDSCLMSNSSSNIKMYPVYDITTFDKRILKSVQTSFNRVMDVRIDMEYQDFDKIKIPKNIFLSVKNPNSDQHLNIKFNNIVLK
jgi:hypothetical protein